MTSPDCREAQNPEPQVCQRKVACVSGNPGYVGPVIQFSDSFCGRFWDYLGFAEAIVEMSKDSGRFLEAGARGSWGPCGFV